MRIRITRNTVANKTAVQTGDIVDVSDADATMLVKIGKAEAYIVSDPPPHTDGPETTGKDEAA